MWGILNKVLVHAELDAIKRANDENGMVTGEVKTKRKRRWKYGRPPLGNGAGLRSPLFVCGNEDCSAMYKLLINTCGLSVFGSKATATDKLPSLHTSQSMPSMPVRCPCQTLGTVLVYLNHLFDCGFFLFCGQRSSIAIGSEHKQEQLNELIELKFNFFQKNKSM
jgi:hypothetical protein